MIARSRRRPAAAGLQTLEVDQRRWLANIDCYGRSGIHRLAPRRRAARGRDSVVVIDDLSSGRTDLVPSEAQLETVSVTDLDAVDAVVGATRPDRIFHLAAQASVTASVTDPYRDC
jgi:nucleoside-diphosphate-sugar epimerase